MLTKQRRIDEVAVAGWQKAAVAAVEWLVKTGWTRDLITWAFPPEAAAAAEVIRAETSRRVNLLAGRTLSTSSRRPVESRIRNANRLRLRKTEHRNRIPLSRKQVRAAFYTVLQLQAHALRGCAAPAHCIWTWTLMDRRHQLGSFTEERQMSQHTYLVTFVFLL